MIIHSRAEWGALEALKVTRRQPSSFKGTVIHWFGTPRAAKTHAGCDDLLRSVQRTHQANKDEGYSDIAYNMAVCPHGHCYTLRGLNRQGGANGTTQTNKDYVAFVYMAGVGDPFPTIAKKAMTELLHWAWDQGVGKQVLTHGSITGSACPGPPVTKWVKEKGYLPNPKPVISKPKVGLRVDVATPSWKLSDQLYKNPAVQARIVRALNSGETVRIAPSKKGT
jgi:hypothetical protein